MVAVLVDVGGDWSPMGFCDCVKEETLPVWDSSVLSSQELQGWDHHRSVGR